MAIRRVTKLFFTMVFIAAAMLAIVFSFDSAEVFAENKPLEKGQIYRVGTCIVPNEGYGQNADYDLGIEGDTFPYNGEYISFTKEGRGYVYKESDSDEVPYSGANIYITYAAQVKNYGGQAGNGAWGSLHDTIVDTPGEYYNKREGLYRFYLMPAKHYKRPDTASWVGEDKGEPWAVQVTRGDGTRDNPYRFQVLFEEPYNIELKVGEHGKADVIAGSPAGEKIKIEDISPDAGYELDKIVMRTDDGTGIKETEITPETDGDYSTYFFTMPEADVSIDISFREKEGLIGVIGSDGTITHFASLDKALSEWKDGTTLKVNDNVTLSGPVTVTDSRTLDLNGYVIKTSGKAFTVKDGGSLTIKDSKPTRRSSFEGTDYIGGHILGSVSGKDKNGEDTVMSGVIDVANGSFTLNGGTIINQYGEDDDVKWGLSVTTGAKVTLNDGCIKATKIAIVDSKKDVSININGGRYNLNAVWPVESTLPDPAGVDYGDKRDHSMVTVTGGYYTGDSLIMMTYWRIAEGYEYESHSIDLLDWEYENYTARISDGRKAKSITTTENIENGAVQTAKPYAKPGDTVTLIASPAEHYRVKNYIVTDADGKEVEVKDGKFTMPESAITINAAFEPIKVSKLRLNKARVTLNETGSYKLKVAVTPSNALNTAVTWSSSDEDVATVDADGNVKAVRAGKAKITAASADGGDTVVCTVTVKHQHHLVKVEAEEATCMSIGQIEHWVCADYDLSCHKIFADEKAEKEITLGDTVIPKDESKHRRLETETRVLKEQTCTSPLKQVIIKYCPTCEKIENMTYTGAPALGHDWGDWEPEKAATETEPGSEKRVCKREGCGETEHRTIPALNHEHDFVKVEGHHATCKEPGNIEYWVCNDKDCGRFFLEADKNTEIDPEEVVVYASGHTAVNEVIENEKAATCASPASYESVMYCADCGEETERTVKTEGSALGHDWSACEKVDEKTHKKVCSRCDEVNESAHNWDDGLEIAPTCSAEGKTIYTCIGCGYSEERDIVEPNPDAHEPGPSVQENRVNATSQKIGGYDLVKRCTICGEVINSTHVVIPKLEKDEYNIDIKTKVEGSEGVTGCTVTGGKDIGKKGERYKLTAKPSYGYEFLYWLAGGKKHKGNNFYLLVNDSDSASEVTVEAVFKRSELPYDGGIMLKVGEAYELGEELYPSGTMPDDIIWESSDNKVAKVNALGTVYAVSAGKAEVTGKLSDGTMKVKYTVTVDQKKSDQPDKTADTSAGTSHNVSGSTYKVLSADTVALTKAKNAKTVTVPATVKIAGKTFKVTKINAKAFKGSRATKLIVKTKKLTKKSVKGSLKGSKIRNVKVKVGKKSVNRKYVKKYKKYFTKKNAGRKVSVK